ncbi:MAG: radical SAM protein [Desulfovibrio sp.]|nr:radical SAM protein [Desulfovibrio sp.]
MSAQDEPMFMVMADAQGQIFDHPELLMLCRHGRQWGRPRPDEMIPLPKESELFLLPGRYAVGLDSHGETQVTEHLAVAAFLAPAHTLSAHPCYVQADNAPMLPLFAYGAVGFARGRFYVCAKKVDNDPRQQFSQIPRKRIEQKAALLKKRYAANRLVQHILNNCVARYDCPAARNFALGRFEAPLPSSRTCNARCLGCISKQDEDSPIAVTPQCRLAFIPKAQEIAEVMQIHASREVERPIYSFGQGCEGDPLQNAQLLEQSIALFRQNGGAGTVNINTNGSRPEVLPALAKAGLTSIRISINSAREELYTAYYRPNGYHFSDVLESVRLARSLGLFVSLNLLFFPGVSDTEEELAALSELVGENGVSMIQLRNLNIDPAWYLNYLEQGPGLPATSGMGLATFMKRLKRLCPWLRFGYFNPWLGERAELSAPLPGTWQTPEKDQSKLQH